MTDPHLDDQGRPEPPFAADEAGTLLGFLDFQRATLAWKTEGLDDEALRASLTGHPSGMSLAGLLKHLAYVEDYWFAEVVGGQVDVEPWASVDWEADGDWDWHSAREDTGEELRALWAASLERSRAIVAGRLDDLGATSPAWGGREQVSLRWVLTHMIEEYARHNGHADLLREQVDGQTGE
ncbi:DinB family protein [Ornithinimicrobium sp. Y1847]|uniref:DinB family protein n=1 Tax=unclassified Ornithinimicrobium TaxID=2615080 RepID=UPI003B6770D6